ncbi:unnamed protein product [Urochloa humidicola]
MAYSGGFGGIAYYNEGLYITIKGEERLYNRIINLVKSIDLSDNDRIGEIPVEIGALVELKNLNLSRNLLHGRIPDTVDSMGSLEFFDLSWNQLSGVIPQSMATLHLLSHLNVLQQSLREYTSRFSDEVPYIYCSPPWNMPGLYCID